MKHPALYLRISDKIISVSPYRKPELPQWSRNDSYDRKLLEHEKAMQAFNDSFIEVSNPEVIPTSESFKIKDGIFVAEGLEFEVKEEQIPCPDNVEGCEVYHFRRVAIISLSSTPDTVEPTAKEGEQPWELQIIKNIWRRAYLDSEEDHVKILKEYGEKIASQERSKVIQEIEESILEEIHVIKNPTEYDYRQVEDARTIVNTTKKIIEKLNQK